MSASPGLLVFSDLDGTLLSHKGYSFAPARPALARLREAGGGLVLASSKTAEEIFPLRAAMGFETWPAIVENGGGLLPAGAAPGALGADYDRLRKVLATLPPGFRGFGDMSVAEVARATGLPEPEARRAKARAFTEPGLWEGPEAALSAFLQAATAAGLAARRGGRFLTLSFGGTKADRMAEIIAAYRPRRTLALGDAPNDIEMLQAADFGVIVRNGDAPPLPRLEGEAEGRIARTEAEGPEGWAEAVLAHIDSLPTAQG
ncbi:MAG: HAD hydrolase family protein [Roseovarius sp.]